jgi:hypothetical protein
MSVGFYGLCVVVDGEDHLIAGRLQAETQAARTAEQVRRQSSSRSPGRRGESLQVGGGGAGVRMR